MSNDWRNFLFVLVFSAGIGLFFGQLLLGVLLALLVWCLWHIKNTRQLDHYLKTNTPPSKFFLSSSLGDVYRFIERLKHGHTDSQNTIAHEDVLAHFNDAPLGMVLLNDAQQIKSFNRKAGEFLRLKASDLNLPVSHLFRNPQVRTNLKQNKSENFAWTDDNHHYLLSLGPWGQDYLLLVQDQTALHKIEEARDELLSNTSHELRTPLCVIKGYTEIMAEAELSKNLRTALDEILLQVQSMEDLINGMLSLARLQETVLDRKDLRPIALVSLVDELMKNSTLLFRAKKIQFRTDIDAQFQVYGKYTELYSAFSNLLHNAMRFSHPQGLILLRWYCDSKGGHFEVIDHGCGIAKQHLPHITKRLYRVDRSSDIKTGLGGSGLGLAIVKHILYRHQAQLHIHSELGKGTTVRCDFPPSMVQQSNQNVQ